jgi:dephospho-CoA kinase
VIRIGLTGSIGMGKSAVSAMFAKLGVPVFDADAEVHRLQGPGSALLPLIEARFAGTTGPAGVDRQKLGAAVFGQAQELRALEAIIHPAVFKARQTFLRQHRSRPMVVLDIPLLFEKIRPGRTIRQADIVVVVSAPAWMQRQRVLARPGASAAKLKQIRQIQVPDSVKRRKADIVINTACLKSETQAAVHHLVACLRAKKGR